MLSRVFAAPVVECPRGYTHLATDVIDLSARLMLFDGVDNLFFCVSFFHNEIS
jgi:hypothetical protein